MDQRHGNQPHSDKSHEYQASHEQIRPSTSFLPFSSDEEFIHHETMPSAYSPPRKRRKVCEADGTVLEHKSTITPALPRRHEIGSLGTRIKLISNCFPIEIPSGYVYHYDVEIVSERRNLESKATGAASGENKDDKKYRCLRAKKNREIISLMVETNQHFKHLNAVYDGQKNLYTRKELVADFPLKCNVILPNENLSNPRCQKTDVFEVQIKPVKKENTDSCAINLDSLHALFKNRTSLVPQDVIMALETILRYSPCLKFTPIGRSFFYPPNPNDLHPLGGGKEIWFGYHQSLRLGQWKPMLNVDITATTFYQKGPLLNYIAEFMNTTVDNLRRNHHIPYADIKRMSNELKNLRIEVNHLSYKRKYRIIRLLRESADRLEFNRAEKGRVVKKTVASYFQDQYRIYLRFPHLPCLQVSPENKNVYLPIEVCDVIEGQHCKKKLEDRQNADMIKYTARAPRERFEEITEIINRSNFRRDDYVREFALEVSREPQRLDGRVLDAPHVRYKNHQIKPENGSWDLRQVQFFKGADIMNWVLISFSRFCTDQHLNQFSNLVTDIGRKMGIHISRPARIKTYDSKRMHMKLLLREIKNKYNADLVVVVVPGKDKTIYGDVKQAAETVIGLTTQCIADASVIKKCTASLVSNLCQKINAKMGGINSSLNPEETPTVMSKPVMIFGADVTHPGPSFETMPSLAAVVGSLDSLQSRYDVECRAQTNAHENKQAMEIILDLKDMVKELLLKFYHHTRGKKPEKIIFYRDGVSEGQFGKVKDHEVRCIREACLALAEDYQPGITFITVQKRHHTRFMPSDARDGVGRMNNIPPGTTVDTAVTHPVNFDFFLCSHFGLQGTSRPAHYTVIEDDNKFSANDLQKLTYYLCYTYARCTRSISIPTPVAYAHLAAFRARTHYFAQIENVSSSSETSASSSHRDFSQAATHAIKVKDNLTDSMYFV